MRRVFFVLVVFAAALVGSLAAVGPSFAQEKPRLGGELIFVVPSEPPSYDGHRRGRSAWCIRWRRTTTRCCASIPFDQTGTQAGAGPGRVVDDLAATG